MRSKNLLIGLSIGVAAIIGLASFVFKTDNVEQNAVKKASKVEILNTQNFDESISQGIVVVDFWATWCRPCLIQAPILDELSTEIGDGVKIAKLDVDKNKAVASKYRVRSIPTIIIFKDSKPVERLVGVQQKSSLKSLIEKHK
jgi:thioredoxin 1